MKYSGTSKIEDILNLEVAQDFLWVCARAERINCACVWAFNCVSGLLSYCFTYTTFFLLNVEVNIQKGYAHTFLFVFTLVWLFTLLTWMISNCIQSSHVLR